MRLFRSPPRPIARPKVTPDPQAAAALEQRQARLDYVPENGFHRDRQQERRTRAA